VQPGEVVAAMDERDGWVQVRGPDVSSALLHATVLALSCTWSRTPPRRTDTLGISRRSVGTAAACVPGRALIKRARSGCQPAVASAEVPDRCGEAC
jgi:hypothetical protein